MQHLVNHRLITASKLSSSSCQSKRINEQLHALKFFRPIHQGVPNNQQLILQRVIARKTYTPNHFKAETRKNAEHEKNKSSNLREFLDGINSSSAKIHPVILSSRRCRVSKTEDASKNIFQQNKFINLMDAKHVITYKMKKRLLCMSKVYSDRGQQSYNEKNAQYQNKIHIIFSDNAESVSSASRLNTARNSMAYLPQCIIKSFGNIKRLSVPCQLGINNGDIISGGQDSGDKRKLVSIGIETDRKYPKAFPLFY